MTLTVATELGEVVVHLSGRPASAAPGLLLLHANPGDHRDFDEIVPALARTWAIAAVDWPGFGRSTAPDPRAMTADGLADVAVLVWDALSTNGFRRTTILGNSVGGYAAIRVAQRRPAQVAGLILVQPAGFAPVNAATRAMFRIMGSKQVARRVVAPSARLYLGALGRGGVRPVYERAAQIPAHPDRLDVYRSIWLSLGDPRLDLRAQAPLLTEVPVQVVWGKHDPINPWFVNKRGVARVLPHADVTVLPTRHEPFCENPDLFLDTTATFLRARAATDA